jgi:hypothetical protein
MEKTLFFYTPAAKGVTNRYVVAGKLKDGVLYMATARCSEFDKFVKKHGRELAEMRLEKLLRGGKLGEKFSRKCTCYEFNVEGKSLGKAFITEAEKFTGKVEDVMQAIKLELGRLRVEKSRKAMRVV